MVVGDQSLLITAVSDNPGVIPDPTITYYSPESTGILAFTPIADQSGTATITVTVEDGGLDNDLLHKEITTIFERLRSMFYPLTMLVLTFRSTRVGCAHSRI